MGALPWLMDLIEIQNCKELLWKNIFWRCSSPFVSWVWCVFRFSEYTIARWFWSFIHRLTTSLGSQKTWLRLSVLYPFHFFILYCYRCFIGLVASRLQEFGKLFLALFLPRFCLFYSLTSSLFSCEYCQIQRALWFHRLHYFGDGLGECECVSCLDGKWTQSRNQKSETGKTHQRRDVFLVLIYFY